MTSSVGSIRRGVPGAPWRTKWHPEHIAQDQLMLGMEGAGLIGVRAYPLLTCSPLARRTGVAGMGFKEGV
jgi:hypothetical protein